jgi:hypothetical protein
MTADPARPSGRTPDDEGIPDLDEALPAKRLSGDPRGHRAAE